MPRPSLLVIAGLALSAGTASAQPHPVPRTILALYDGRYERETRYLPIHQIAEMPLNHLGLVVRYHDINAPLPRLEGMTDVRGVLTWFRSDAMADPIRFLTWADGAIDAGKRFVVVGDIAAGYDLARRPTPAGALQAFWSRLGLRPDGEWTTVTYDWAVSHIDRTMFEFERPLGGVLPAFPGMRKVDDRVRSYLVIRRSGDASTDAQLAAVGPHGGYIAAGYAHYATTDDPRGRQWYLNPFAFFREAFATDDLPKPDTTTVSGRRLFYSHVDGDGWRNLTELAQYRRRRTTSAQVILDHVIRRFPDLPITVAPVGGDIDPAWHGSEEMRRLARDILALPHVEAGSHTYSHPLEWSVLERAGARTAAPADEHLLTRLTRWVLGAGEGAVAASPARPPSDGVTTGRRRSAYEVSRTYDVRPFSVDLEVRDSIAFINGLLPPGKAVRVLQWSGNTLPGEASVAAARRAGVRNLNGGDTRFDPEFPSYGWVAPLGRTVGAERQVFASNSNENTYTDLWTERFFGFKFLTGTLENTESPIRVKPHNIYFHMYSGEKLPSLSAVLDNYRYASTRELAPVTASHFAAIVDGFFTATITEVGPRAWRIERRDALQTIRFDDAADQSVDYGRSSGVIGHRRYQGSLYVALDAADPAPVVALTTTPASGPYLVHARWLISDVRTAGGGFAFRAQGFGRGVAVWQVRPSTSFAMEVTAPDRPPQRGHARSDETGALTLDLGPASQEPMEVRVEPS